MNLASSITGYSVSEAQLNSLLTSAPVAENGERQNLYTSLISDKSILQGTKKSAQVVDNEINKLRSHLTSATVNQPILERLEREVRFNELIYTSVLGKVSLSGTDVYVNYPLLQILSRPTMPEEPSSPNVKIVLAGALVSSLLAISALGLIWLRSNFSDKYFKKEKTDFVLNTNN